MPDIREEFLNACKLNNLPKMKELIKAGANVNDYDDIPPIFMVASRGNLDAVNLLIKAGANVNLTDTMNITPLMIACYNKYIGVVKALIKAGADLNLKNKNGNSALIMAINNNIKPIINILIKAGADVNIKDNNGKTPLYLATSVGHLEIIKTLIEAGADVNIKDNNGETAIYSAVSNNKLEAIKPLVEAGANVNIQNNNGYTPLHSAVINNRLRIIKILIEAGADVNIKSINNETPLDMLIKKCNVDILKYFLEAVTINADIKTDLVENARNDKYCPEFNTIILEKLGNGFSIKLWKGWTRSDIEKLDTIFDEENANNYSCCPVCLKFTDREMGCMYMTHNCMSLGGYYHKELYNKYKNTSGNVTWCTICNRIAVGHAHYPITPANGPVPEALFVTSDPFEKDCRVTSKGGGLPEKVMRFRRLREYALEAQEDIDKKPEKEVLDELVEEMWNAPLRRERVVAKIMSNKKWNIPSNRFPANRVENKVANAPNVKRDARNAEELKPIVEAVGMNFMAEEENMIHFRHRNADGTINEHEGMWITKTSLENFLSNAVKNFGEESFGYCYTYPDCKSPLYPEEIKNFVPEELYEDYRKKFNRKFQGMMGGRRKEGRMVKTSKHRKGSWKDKTKKRQRGGNINERPSIFVEATNAVCSISSKKGRFNNTMKRRRRN